MTAVTTTAGQSFIEPPGVEMTVFNYGQIQPAKILIFNVAGAGTPFLDAAPH